MSYRFMRTIVMFDLPSTTNDDLREYRKFRKFLISSGFMMLQESIYCKLIFNATAQMSLLSNIRKNKPKNGIVQVLTITEKQYGSMEFIIGESTSTLIDNDERLVIL